MLAAIILRDEQVRKTFERVGFISIGQVHESNYLGYISLRNHHTFFFVDAQSARASAGSIRATCWFYTACDRGSNYIKATERNEARVC